LGTVDIAWMTSFAAALGRARRERRPVVVKPLGQGMVDDDSW
jgi:hypothetical protein